MNAKTLEAVRKHGELLLAIFPEATERDPVALCKKLRRLEVQASRHTLELCNGDEPGHGVEWQNRHDAALFLILNKVNVLLGNTTQSNAPTLPVFINRDPRGYALKNEGWRKPSGDCGTIHGHGAIRHHRARFDRSALTVRDDGDTNMKTRGYNVRLNGKWIDKAFQSGNTGKNRAERCEYVKRSLVNHDGYDVNITVKEAR